MERLDYMPYELVAGASIAKLITLSDYTPAAGWALAYQFAASTPFAVNGVANEAQTGWTVTLTGAQTLPLAPGSLTYVAFVTKSGSVVAVDAGTITVIASPLRVSEWAAALTACKAAIANYAAAPEGSISVDGVSVSYRSLEQLTNLHDWLDGRVRMDTTARIPRRILTRFKA